MALLDFNSPNSAFDPALAEISFHDTAQIHDDPSAALARLPLLWQEADRNFHLARFLASSPRACLALMLMATLVLALSGAEDGGSLKADFAWATAVLAGIIAMTRNYLRGHARPLPRMNLEEAACELRVILLYLGAAWGMGAFLIMPDLPAPAMAFGFALAPGLAIALSLGDRIGVAGFVAPACLATAGAALLGAWPFDIWVGASILAFGGAILCLPMLRCAIDQYETSLPR
jgi:hypothetical protein